MYWFEMSTYQRPVGLLREGRGGRLEQSRIVFLRRQVFGYGTGFVWQTGVAEQQEVVEGALVNTVEAGLVAMEEIQLGGGGQLGERAGDAGGLVLAGRLVLEGLLHQAILDGPGAAHAPVRGGHFLDHTELDAIEGAEAVGVLGHEVVERLAGFVGQNDAAGQETMAHGVGGRAVLAVGGDRSAGAGAVGPRSVDASE